MVFTVKATTSTPPLSLSLSLVEGQILCEKKSAFKELKQEPPRVQQTHGKARQGEAKRGLFLSKSSRRLQRILLLVLSFSMIIASYLWCLSTLTISCKDFESGKTTSSTIIHCPWWWLCLTHHNHYKGRVRNTNSPLWQLGDEWR